MKCAICGKKIDPALGYIFDNPNENGDPTPESEFYHSECMVKAIKAKLAEQESGKG